MVKLDLIIFADLVRPTDIVSEIFRQNPQLPIPVPISEIAQAAGIYEIQYRPLDGLEGALVANTEKTQGIIVVNNRPRPHRQKFTLGHELGHFMIPRHNHEMACNLADLTTKENPSLNRLQRIELEANAFAAELLMPTIAMRAFGNFESEPSMEGLIKLAEHLDVSFEACANRYVYIHPDPIAVVFSHNGIVRYNCRDERKFPFWITPGKGTPVPNKSFTRTVDTSAASRVTSNSVDSCIWLNDHRHIIAPEEIIEDVYVMENGYVATMLFFDEEIDECL
jgi:Zn-dependent peptidase ImmA (M78 family)